MPDRYYDVVVIGRSLGALTAAALLARRDFTVALFGQGQPAPSYALERHGLRRTATPLLSATSPVWRRVLGELAYSQTWNRKTRPVLPLLQAVMPGCRFDLPPDVASLARELQREFPEARGLVADLYDDLARVTAAADSAFEHDAVWPPGTFLERRKTNRLAATLPYTRAQAHADLLADFPRHHPYRRLFHETVQFSTDLAGALPAFAAARLHGLWAKGPVTLPNGPQELEELLVERIDTNGGRCLLGERVVGIEVRRGALVGVHVAGETSTTGAGFVIADATGEDVAALAGGQGVSKRALREWPRVTPATGRFVVSALVRRGGVPAALGPEAFVVAADGHSGPRAPSLHLQRCEVSGRDETLLVAETLIPERGRQALKELRGRVLERLCTELPFLEPHLLVVDSVHDGLPVWCYRDGQRQLVARTSLTAASPRAEPLEPQLEIDPPGYLGLAGEPVRGPIERTLLVGPSVLPALGQEGRLLAAWAAARVVNQSDKRKARMRREMWTKIEIS